MNSRRIASHIRRIPYIFATLIGSLLLLSLATSAQNSFKDYDDVQQVLASSTDVLPPELTSSDLSARRNAWTNWVMGHDHEIRSRLVRGDEDTIVNWLLFGTSFTRQPSALFDASLTDGLSRIIGKRTKDLITALASSDQNERIVFARRLLLSQGYKFDTAKERSRLERRLQAEVERVVAERRQYLLREDAFPTGDVIEQIMVQSTLFRDRGLSLDTSILPSFAIQQALETMSSEGLLPPNSIRRVAVIGPGLDFADKNSGYDFYPVQTLQPFTSIDSLLRLGLAASPADIELAAFDISPRVNDHIGTLQRRAKTGAPYVLRLPTELSSNWAPALVSYWKSIGDRIGSETVLPRPPEMPKSFGLRGVEVRPQVAARITPVDFNVVTEKWTGPPFDLVIATNVLVYYDKLDQALAMAGIEGMLRPGGFFLTNNAIVELPSSRLRSVGVLTVRHSADKLDHIFWYRRNAS